MGLGAQAPALPPARGKVVWGCRPPAREKVVWEAAALRTPSMAASGTPLSRRTLPLRRQISFPFVFDRFCLQSM